MRTDDLHALFRDTIGEPPPMALSSDDVARAGSRVLERRRARWAAVGSAAAVTAVAAGMAVPTWRGGNGPRAGSGAGPAASAPGDTAGAATGTGTPAAVRSTEGSPRSEPLPPVSAARACPVKIAGGKAAGPGRARALPWASDLAVAVTRAAPRIAPGMRVTVVRQWDSPTDPRSGEPLVTVWFDVSGPDGAGGMGFEVMPSAEPAATVQRRNPYGYCVPPELRAAPGGGKVLVYRQPFGDPKVPDSASGRVSLFRADKVQVDLDSVPWAYSALDRAEQKADGPGAGNPPATRRTLPLTPEQLYQFALVANELVAR